MQSHDRIAGLYSITHQIRLHRIPNKKTMSAKKQCCVYGVYVTNKLRGLSRVLETRAMPWQHRKPIQRTRNNVLHRIPDKCEPTNQMPKLILHEGGISDNNWHLLMEMGDNARPPQTEPTNNTDPAKSPSVKAQTTWRARTGWCSSKLKPKCARNPVCQTKSCSNRCRENPAKP